MVKSDLIVALQKNVKKMSLNEETGSYTSITKKDASIVIDAFVQTIKDVLMADDFVRLTGFGSFSVKDVPARVGKNPMTGEVMEISAKKRPVFKASPSFKDEMNNK